MDEQEIFENIRRTGWDRLIDRMRTAAGDRYWSLASPYSRFPDGTEAAFRHACQAAGWFIKNQIPVFCPIAHSHPVAVQCRIPLTDHAIWLPADRPMMNGAAGIAVLMMPSWKQSTGIQHEIGVFLHANKPVEYLPWPLP
jgi:hypothetical protein